MLKHNLGTKKENLFNWLLVKIEDLQQILMAPSTEQMKNSKKGDFMWSNANNRYIMGIFQLLKGALSRNGNGSSSVCTVHMENIIYYSVDTKGWKQKYSWNYTSASDANLRHKNLHMCVNAWQINMSSSTLLVTHNTGPKLLLAPWV